jgi:TonB family C-terminal domain
MEIKKTKRANIEKEIPMSFLMGLVLGLAVLFVGFEMGDSEVTVATDSGTAVVIDEEEVEITRQEEVLPPPPAPEVIQAAPEVITIVEDNIKVETNIMTSEDDASHAQTATYVAPAAVAQEEEEADESFVFVSVEKMPEFPGGDIALLKWISENINYPTIAAENGVQGRVSCTFVVNADGSVSDAQVVRPLDPNLDKEAIRVLQKLPKFRPGEQRGKPVRVKYSVPVRFQLKQ